MKSISILRWAPVIILLAGWPPLGFAAEKSNTPRVERADGGSMKTDLGYGIVLNSQSSLTRRWISVDGGKLPSWLIGAPGVTTQYESGRSVGRFTYKADMEFETEQPITAIELRFVLFDVWGETIRTLSLTEVRDFSKGKHQLDGVWNLYSENEASDFFASIAYIARVRTSDGKVLKTNPEAIIEVGREFKDSFAVSDLEPAKGKE